LGAYEFFLKDVLIIHQNILIKQYKFRFLLVLYLKIQQKNLEFILFFFMSKSKMRTTKHVSIAGMWSKIDLSHCGQENTDTRKTFHHLLFILKILPLRKCFWRTIKNLLFKPAALNQRISLR
jgi:hypothetical protein